MSVTMAMVPPKSTLIHLACVIVFMRGALSAISDNNDSENLHDVLPMAGETVTKMLELLQKNAAILALLPKNAKVALAKEQMRRNEKDFEKFNELPKRTQEKLLGKFLSTNVGAQVAFEKNVDIFEGIGVKFDPKVVLAIAKEKSQK